MIKKTEFEEVTVEKLRWRCDPDSLGFETTDDIEVCEKIIGQERAVKAIQMGLNIKSKGYNIFATGLAGTGRTTTIKYLLKELKERKKETPDDKCYVNNFKNPDMPRVISLLAGRGREFKSDMERLVDSLRRDIPAVFESENYQIRRKEIINNFGERQKSIIREFEGELAQDNFTLIQIKMGPFTKPDIAPLIEGKPVSIDQLGSLAQLDKFPQEDYRQLKDKYTALTQDMEEAFRKSRDIDKALSQALRELDNEVIMPLVTEAISEIEVKYKSKDVLNYLKEVQKSIVENLDRFRVKEGEEAPPPGGKPLSGQPDPFLEYRVNVIVDNSETEGAPIIIEIHPSYNNLFGTIERVMDKGGVWRTDFTKIKAGSILRANGGYLVLNAQDVMMEPGVWPALKRTLRNEIVEVQRYDPLYLFTTSALKPEPIEVKIKVVMIGSALLYELLSISDNDFRKVFKIRADFDVVMSKEAETIHQYASLIRKICSEDELKPFDKTGVSAIVEFGVRLAGRQNKLSTRFNIIVDLVREASYWADMDNSDKVNHRHVDRAISSWIERESLIKDKLQEMIEEGTILLNTEGVTIGQVNGLSVYAMGNYAFGKPSRITAETSLGSEGVVNIEREAGLSGMTYDKGVSILTGYLSGKYTRDKPLSMNASICFEQSYGGVEGDSASSTEVYAILSDLAELPLRQDIAVTGSINQKGEIQPIGGVNEKIEGFYEVCKAKELTGTQGVAIPYQNIENLMLNREVIKAVKESKFHIYPIKTIDEGIEILTGLKAGERRKDGTFEEGTINYLVDKRLQEMAQRWKDFTGG